MQILSTMDYSIFKFLPENREIKKRNVQKKIDLLRTGNKMNVNPILVNKEMFVIDGQHRLKACEYLNLEVFYIIDEDFKLIDLQIFNNNNIRWTVDDFMNYWAKTETSNYRDTLQFYESTGLSLITCLAISGFDYGSAFKKIKNGTFSFKIEEQIFISVINNYKEVVDYLKEKIIGNKMYLNNIRFLRALSRLIRHEYYDHKKFMKNLPYVLSKLHPCVGYSQYLDMVFSSYNFRNSSPIEP